MRFHPALALVAVLLPALAPAQTDEWVRDDMSDDSLWLLRTGNLAREAPRAGTLPGAPAGTSHWVMSKGDGPAYVVYFIPGRIHEVEIDTHRLAGATGDFSLAVSTDGKLYQPLDAGAVLLDTSFGWDYRLMASDQIPENATHLLVQFPDGSTAHSLSEVWIRYTWDDALVRPFLPKPVAEPRQQEPLAAQSDAELQAMLEQLMAQAAPPPAQEVFPIAPATPATFAPIEFVAEPLRAPHIVESAATMPFATPDAAENTTTPVVIEEEPASAITTDGESFEAAVEMPDPASVEADSIPAIEPPVAQPELEPLIEITLSVDAPAEEDAPLDTDAEPNPAAAVEAPVEIPVEVATETEYSPVGAENAVAVPESATEDIANASATEEVETSEEVHVLPVFTLPVFESGETSDAPLSPQFESPPSGATESVVLKPALPAIDDPLPVTQQETEPIESPLPEIESPQAHNVALESPATPKEPSPALVAATTTTVAPAESDDAEEISADDEPKAKPAMKIRRFGPRSKSRGTLVARD
jgi:hypothetical protein